MSGKVLHDGAACLLNRKGVVGALAEERIAKRKRAGGYKYAMESLFHSFGVRASDLQRVVVSTCCEPMPDVQQLPEFPATPVISCNHHVSHALSVFCTSSLQRAIILVLDAGGNTLQSVETNRWWSSDREQQTYFVCDGTDLTKVGSDFEDAYAAGFGEIFRAFTYFLGWPSSRYAGNLMALAAHGNPVRLQASPLFTRDGMGKLRSPISNDPKKPIEMAKNILSSCGIGGIEPRGPGGPFLDVHKDLAAWVQNEFELTLCEIVGRLVEETGVDDLCLAGGVAYNCKAVNALRKGTQARNVYLGPASGDHGQSLGNALYGLWMMDERIPSFGNLSPYLGPERTVKEKEVIDLLKVDDGNWLVSRPSNLCKSVAMLLAMGCIMGWYQGRSEFGPRALGNRSILASPSLTSVSDRLNRIKGRDSFMPFAPSVLASEIDDYFVDGIDVPYMSDVLYVKDKEKAKIVGTVNEDGSARIHTVTKERNRLLYDLISEFFALTKIPMVLNTSFNGAGEPIVETAVDAVSSFLKLELDGLIVGDIAILSKEVDEFARDTIPVSIDNGRFHDTKICDILQMVRESGKDRACIPRDRFLLQSEFFRWVLEGRKCTTVRYRTGAVEYPLARHMPVFVTDDFSRTPRGNQEAVFRIDGYQIKKFGDLTDSDAKRDGFRNISELQRVLTEIYGNILPNEPVIIYSVDII